MERAAIGIFRTQGSKSHLVCLLHQQVGSLLVPPGKHPLCCILEDNLFSGICVYKHYPHQVNPVVSTTIFLIFLPPFSYHSAVTTGLKKVSFHSNPKERQCQRMFKLCHNCTHLTRQQSNAQNSPIQVSTVHHLLTSKCSSLILKRQRNQRSNCQHLLDHRKSKRVPEKHLLLLY